MENEVYLCPFFMDIASVTTYEYTNDAQGNPLSAVVTDPSSTYKSQTYEYIYEDAYFLDTTGLETPEN